MTLQLTEKERGLLIEVVASRLGELRQEVHHSMVSSFTTQLKETEQVLKQIIAKLETYDDAPVGSAL